MLCAWWFASSALAGEVSLASLPTLGAAYVPPGVIVGFNPQPDPPGEPYVDLTRPFAPTVALEGDAREFVVTFDGDVRSVVLPASACGTRTDTVLYPYAPRDVAFPSRCGTGTFTLRVTTSRGETADLEVSVAGLSGGSPGSIVGFNPQPDPPGPSSIGIAVDFGTMRYTGMSLDLGLRDARGTLVELR